MVIHKQILKITDQQVLLLPSGAEILSVGNQHENICIWYKCEPSIIEIRRLIYIRGTGHEMNGNELHFIGTVIMANGDLVWHVFEG